MRISMSEEEKIKCLLFKQIELLSEQSEECNNSNNLVALSHALCEVANVVVNLFR